MQRATYLAQLYESVSSIPPDIRQCLLTVAQYGCDPDQVRRWYNLVRSRYGIGEVDSPTELSHQTTKPISRAKGKKAQSTVVDAAKREPPATPDLRTQGHFQDPGPWSSPAPPLANHIQYGTGLSEVPGSSHSQQHLENLFDPSTALPPSAAFTGHGLVPAHDSYSHESFNPELMAKSPAMPLLEPFNDVTPFPTPRMSPRPKTVDPSSVLRSSPEQAKTSSHKRRKLTQKEDVKAEKGGRMEPPQRPRRPSVPFRSNEQPCLLPLPQGLGLETDPVIKTESHLPSSQCRLHSPFEDLYIRGQLHRSPQELLPSMIASPEPFNQQRPSSPPTVRERAGERPSFYQSPYRSVEQAVTSC